MGSIRLQCRICGFFKDEDEFNKRRDSPTGRDTRCKACRKAAYDADPGPVIERVQARYWADPDASRARRREHYQDNRDEELRQRKAFRDANPDHMRAQKHAEYERNRETARERSRRHYEANAEEYKQRAREWRQENPQAVQVYKDRRRRALNRADVPLQPEEWQFICMFYEQRCVCCGAEGALTIDHVIPLALGGTHSRDNIQPLCRSCNSRKHTQTTDYRQQLPPWEAWDRGEA